MRTWKNILSLIMAVAMIFSMGVITAFADAAPNGVAPETVAFYGSENTPAISGTNDVALTSNIEIGFSSFTAVDNKGWDTGNWTVNDDDIATQTGLTVSVDNTADKVTISGQPTSSHDGWVYLSASNDSGSTGKIALYAVIQAGRDDYEIEIKKTVVQGGTVTPPAETFEFEIVSSDGSPLNADFGFQWENDNSGAISNKIVANGANTYEGVLTFSTAEGKFIDLLGAGFRICEKTGSAANWSYDTTYYLVQGNQVGQETITKVSGQSREIVTSIVFTNTYTKSNWAPQNPGRTDDDDDEVYYIITATAHEGGSISPKGKVKVWEYDDKAFNITPKDGYMIDKVLVDGKDVGSVDFYEFKNVTSDHTIEAFFRSSSQPDPSKSNPNTGAGTPMDYLTYLFHKYILWFL